MIPTGLVYHPDCGLHDTGRGHPEHAGRLHALLDALARERLLERADVRSIEGRYAQQEDLARVHAPAHIETIRHACERAGREGIVHLDSDTAVSAGSWDAARAAAGSLLAAADAVAGGELRNAFCAVRPPGHHSTAERAMGFCLFNNVAVAVRYAQARLGWRRALIVDWDLHHGNGTQEIFYADPDVFYLSMHQYPHYPGTGSEREQGVGPGAGTTRNVPVPPGWPPERYVRILCDALDRTLAGFHPDAVFISAGFDAAQGDPLGGLTLRPDDYFELTRTVMRHAQDSCAGRIVSALEGGYDPNNLGQCAAAHLRALCGAPGTPGLTPA